MNVHTQPVNTYSLRLDNPQTLTALLTTALANRLPLVVIATDETTGAVARREGYVTDATPNGVVMSTGNGEQFRCRRWEIDRAALIAEMWEAA